MTHFISGIQLQFKMEPLPFNPKEKIRYHIDALFGAGAADCLPEDFQFEYSARTGRIKCVFIENNLVATFRTDGGIALTIFGATALVKGSFFKENCVIPCEEAIPFVSEGRSLFCKHVEWCGSNIKIGSEVALIDKNNRVIATGKALFGSKTMNMYSRGVAVKVREGIKSRVK